MRNSLLASLFVSSLLVAVENPTATLEESASTPWSIKASDHLLFSNASDNATDKSLPTYKLFMNEATLRADYGSVNGNIRFANRYTPDGKQTKNAAFRLEKKLIAYEGENLEVKLGDSYQELGKGIALSLYNDALFGIDNTLEGASVIYRGNDVSVGAFGGRVNTLRLPVAINPVTDPLFDKDVWMGGAHAKVKYSKEGTVGAHSLISMNENFQTHHMTKRYLATGVTLAQENIVDGLDGYIESNLLNTEQIEPSRTTFKNGYGSYASLAWSGLPWKAQLEGKDYRNFGDDTYHFVRPPTLEEDVIRQNNFIDVSAARLRVERRMSDSGTANVYVSYLAGVDREQGAFISHPVIGTKIPLPLKAEMELKAGYRWLPNRQNLQHAGVKAKIKTFKAQMIEAEYRKQLWHLGLASVKPTNEDRNIFSLGYTFSEALSLIGGYEYIPTNDGEAGKNFYNIGGAYRTSNFQTRAFLGQTSGGIQCSGGVCRKVDPYTGAYIDTVVSF